jgi:hypothetical protein
MILPPPPLGDHLRGGELRAEEDASEVDVDHVHEIVLAHLRERDEREDSRVVHEHVEPLEVLRRLVDEPLHARPIGDVDRVREGRALPLFLEGLRGRDRRTGLPVRDDHVRPRLVQPRGDRQPDPHRAARHDGGLAREVEQLFEGALRLGVSTAHGGLLSSLPPKDRRPCPRSQRGIPPAPDRTVALGAPPRLATAYLRCRGAPEVVRALYSRPTPTSDQ